MWDVWSNAFADTLDAVLLFFEGCAYAASAKVWFDVNVIVTSNNGSTGPSNPSSWRMSTFSITRIGGTVCRVTGAACS
jgi:hypothetical protein